MLMKYYSGDKIKGNEMGRTWDMWGGEDKYVRTFG